MQDPLVRRLLRMSRLLFPGHQRVVVAVSGGADSLALLHLLLQSGLTPPDQLLVAHFDHNLRDDSGMDADFVAETARKLGVAFDLEIWRPGNSRANLPARARQARYNFLLRCAHCFGATRVATGHHQNDQAETFIERLLRGSGVTGLAAMGAARPLDEQITLVRPLLVFSRSEIENWLTGQQQVWREDPSNYNPAFRRNRIRHQVMPRLQDVSHGNATRRIAEAAAAMERAEAALEWSLDRCWPQLDVLTGRQHTLSLAHTPLAALPDELAARCLRRCHRLLTKDISPPGSKAMAGFLYLLHTPRRAWFMRMRGLEVRREQNRVLFLAREGSAQLSLG